MIVRTVAAPADYSLGETLLPLRFGRDDPTMRWDRQEVWRARRTDHGTVTLHAIQDEGAIRLEAWGDGADAAMETGHELLGMDDRPADFTPPADSLLAVLRQRHPGLRLARSADPTDALLRAITARSPSSFESHRAHRQLILALGEDAPGPGGLRVPPTSDRIAGTPAYDLHTIGFAPHQADLLRRAAAQAHRFDGVVDSESARALLTSMSWLPDGVRESVLLDAFGDPDAVPIGDLQRAHRIGEVIADEPEADDRRMLELLDPWRGQRGRVIRLVEAELNPSLQPRSA